jgi:uncharacterized protein YecE (DUF72 family)
MIYLGTSGFSYKDWVGAYYPPGLPQRNWLAMYSQEFNSCEINSTYYALPRPEVLKAMADKTHKDFSFAIKANQDMTHQRYDSSRVCQAFRQMLEPVVQAGKLGCVLAQFPYSFDFTTKNWEYLAKFRKYMEGIPLVIEFRNAGWLKVEVFDWMRHKDIGFCCVDEPRLPNLIPPVAEVTSRIGYVRFHGRNKDKWWNSEQPYERYDYSYKTEELREWIPKIKKIAGSTERTYIFANNHWRAQSIDTIRQLRTLLD